MKEPPILYREASNNKKLKETITEPKSHRKVTYVRIKVKSTVTFKNLIYMSLTVIKPC